jgi:hypothetical protein
MTVRVGISEISLMLCISAKMIIDDIGMKGGEPLSGGV